MKCRYCESKRVVKNGFQGNGCRKYKCKQCHRYFQEHYSYPSSLITDKQIILLTKEGCGIRSTSRILNISPSTVIRRIKKIAHRIQRPFSIITGKSYEVDELFTYVKCKINRICIAYSYEVISGDIIDFIVGRRNKINLGKVIDTLVLSKAAKITTDKLNLYKLLIPKEIHSTKFRGINRIERNNLNLRIHLKRLNRRTLCYSKSLVMLFSIVKIYFWG